MVNTARVVVNVLIETVECFVGMWAGDMIAEEFLAKV